MVATAAFVIVFVVIGVSVVLVAMGGGPKTARENLLHRQGRSARRSTAAIIAVVIGFGLALPVLVMAVNADDGAKKVPGGVKLSDAQVNGRQIFADLCATCHTLAASNAVGKVGTNLDDLRPPKALILNALAKGRANGRGQMPAELVEGEEAKDVAAYIVAVAGRK